MTDETNPRYEKIPPGGSLIENLRSFHGFCGEPSFGDLQKISRQLGTVYGDRRYANLERLAPSTTSAILAGKRKKAPKRAWLVAFVLSCEWYAWHECGNSIEWPSRTRRTGPPVPERVLAFWTEKHQAVLSKARASRNASQPIAATPEALQMAAPGAAPLPLRWPQAALNRTIEVGGARAPARTEDRTGAVPVFTGRPRYALSTPPAPSPGHDPGYGSFEGGTDSSHARFFRNTPMISVPLGGRMIPVRTAQPVTKPQVEVVRSSPSHGHEAVQPAVLSRSELRIRDLFGFLGLQLYDRAEEGHAEAAYRLGVLLCADGALSEGQFYLDKAKEHRHSGAAALRRIVDRYRLRQRALETLLQFATDARTDNQVHTAVSYCVPAARNDHPDSAHLLAVLLTGMGKNDLALTYLRYAAFLGHRGALKDLTGTENISRLNRIQPPSKEAARLLALIVPEPRFERGADSTQPLDVKALFDTYAAEDEAATRKKTQSTPYGDFHGSTARRVAADKAGLQERSPALSG
jgi:hypothetical protein